MSSQSETRSAINSESHPRAVVAPNQPRNAAILSALLFLLAGVIVFLAVTRSPDPGEDAAAAGVIFGSVYGLGVIGVFIASRSHVVTGLGLAQLANAAVAAGLIWFDGELPSQLASISLLLGLGVSLGSVVRAIIERQR